MEFVIAVAIIYYLVSGVLLSNYYRPHKNLFTALKFIIFWPIVLILATSTHFADLFYWDEDKTKK